MPLRPLPVLAALALGIAAIGEAAAQYYPPPPPYAAPPGAYPGGNAMDDEDDDALPGPPGAVPYGRYAPPPGRDAAPRPDLYGRGGALPDDDLEPLPPNRRYGRSIETQPLPAPGSGHILPGGSQPDRYAPPPPGRYAEPPAVIPAPQGQEAARPLPPAGQPQPYAYGGLPAPQDPSPRPPVDLNQQRAPASPSVASLPPDDQPEEDGPKELPAHLKRQLVDYPTREPVGTIVIDTPNTYLYVVQPGGKAMRYGIGVGRDGFTWTGTERVSRMAEWPDWHPPKEMIERQPYLPRFMAGGPGNPLGARAMYLGKTLYRIHGTNQPSTIGSFVSSGCIRLLNEDVEDLYGRVQVGTRVVVLPGGKPRAAGPAAAAAR